MKGFMYNITPGVIAIIPNKPIHKPTNKIRRLYE
jgi:hypothetical protein